MVAVSAIPTIVPDTLSVASAFPDPPFELVQDGVETGFDVELMRAICASLGLTYAPVKFDGHDFNAIFEPLASRGYDAVISGTTVTAERETVARFTRPYLESGQSLVVNRVRTPHIRSVDDLAGQVIGIQAGNTSDAVAKKLHAEGKIASIRYYAYGGIEGALDDLTAGTIGGFIKLLPVTTWLVRDRPDLAVVQEIPTHERLAIACALDNHVLCRAIDGALAGLEHDGTVDRLPREVGRCAARSGRRHMTIRLVHLFTGDDGQSHFTDGAVDLHPLDTRNSRSVATDVVDISFEASAPGSSLEWHNTPTTQYVITLSGTLEFETRSGDTFRIAPGDVLLAADTTGGGHRWHLVDDQPWRHVYVTIPPPSP